MQINIYKDKMLGARLFGASVLYSAAPIPREDVPQGWYCYDLRGTARHPDEPHALVDLAEENHAGSILSCLPLKKGGSQFRLVKDMFQMTGTNPSLAEFCAEEKIRCPETPVRHQLCPASPEDAGLFYSQTPEKDRKGPPPEPSAAGPVGKGRRNEAGGVFAARRKQNRAEFLLTRWPRGPEELNPFTSQGAASSWSPAASRNAFSAPVGMKMKYHIRPTAASGNTVGTKYIALKNRKPRQPVFRAAARSRATGV